MTKTTALAALRAALDKEIAAIRGASNDGTYQWHAGTARGLERAIEIIERLEK